MVVLGKDVCAEAVGATGSYSLRVGGLFAILFGSAILTFLPIAARNRCQLLLQLGSCFATGVVLATAFVHMIPDASMYPVFSALRSDHKLWSLYVRAATCALPVAAKSQSLLCLMKFPSCLSHIKLSWSAFELSSETICSLPCPRTQKGVTL